MGNSATANLIRLGTPIETLSGLPAKYLPGLARLGIQTVGDLIRHLPTRYERIWGLRPIDELPMDQIGTTRGTITATRVIPGRRRGTKPAQPRFEATLQDHTTKITLIWFNAVYLHRKLHPGMAIRVQGKAAAYKGKAQMVNPQWQLIEHDTPQPNAPPPGGHASPNHALSHTTPSRLRPIYPATEGLPSDAIQQLVDRVLPQVLPQITDPLPSQIAQRHGLPPLDQAFQMAHQPTSEADHRAARRRLAYNELLLLQLGIAVKRSYNHTRLVAPALRWSDAIDRHIQERFPFELTAAQRRVVHEITHDLQRSIPMNRLVQGDVGAGKTVVALYALLLAVANRKQGALMAPTELLAEQHHRSILAMLKGSNVKIMLLTASQTTAKSHQRAQQLDQIHRGQVDLVIGTQALLTQAVTFHDLAVVVVDEQHRFGVLQRAAFRQAATRAGPPSNNPCVKPAATPGPAILPTKQRSPHYLVMTATPIPRTLSLTVFGDLDVSTIDALPPGRTPITTRVVTPDRADQVYQHAAKRVARGEQVYVVVPLIDAINTSDDACPNANPDTAVRHHTATQLKNVRAQVRLLSKKYFPNHKVAAVHGRLKRQTRESIMDRFRKGQLHVLVATTVIEVGVDVPNATMMVVEHADRFGLAQLHQLRGRVGRGGDGRPSLCVFIAKPTTPDAAKRLDAIASTRDGFKIAQHDLEIRGMGDFFGTRQHGLAPLRVASIPHDMPLLQSARRDAQKIIDADPTLLNPAHQRLRQVLVQQYGQALGLIDVG